MPISSLQADGGKPLRAGVIDPGHTWGVTLGQGGVVQGTREENSKGFCDSLSYPVLMVLQGAGEGQPALPT